MPEEEAAVGTPKSPQLLHHKPSKAQVKKAKKASAPPPTMDPSSGSTTTTSTTSTPPPAPKRKLLRRMIPLLLAANFAVGAYVLLRTTDKKPAEESEHVEEAPATPVTVKEGTDTKKTPETQPKPSVPAPIKLLPSVPEDEQRKLFKWMLEEKRKIKATSSLEKKKIDEEKALLKRYMRAESFPSI